MAADCIPEFITEQDLQHELPNFETEAISTAAAFGSFSDDEIQALHFNAANSDAGSTRATAHDLGILIEDGASNTSNHSLGGSLSYFDRMDVFRFSIEEDTNFEVTLGGLWGNADLIIANASGQAVATSRNSGTATESVDVELSEGVYYIGVQARNFWGTGYRLDVTAESLAPPPPSQIDLSTPRQGNDSTPDSGTGTQPETGTTDDVQPLSDVPYFGGRLDWNVNAVNAPEAWAEGYSGQGVTVAVIDTGVDINHPDLVNNIFVNPGEIPGNGIDDDQNGYVDDVSGYDFVSNDANPDDGNGHGTHVAGTIASLNNGSGSTGIAPNASILPVKVLSDSGSGSNFSVAAGIRYAADLGAEVINLSLGGGYSRAVHSAIDYAGSLGSIVIAAAGNESAAVPSSPAQLASTLPNLLSVGAHDSTGRTASFSNRVGPSGAVQIDAPGVGVYSTYHNGRFGSLSGTSMASPHVAGVAALALSANPNLTPSELRSLLVEGTTAQAVGSDAVGIVNAATTVAYAAAGITTATPSAQQIASPRSAPTGLSRAISVELQAPTIESVTKQLERTEALIDLSLDPQTLADRSAKDSGRLWRGDLVSHENLLSQDYAFAELLAASDQGTEEEVLSELVDALLVNA